MEQISEDFDIARLEVLLDKMLEEPEAIHCDDFAETLLETVKFMKIFGNLIT